MEPKIKTSLEDILCAIEEIESFFESRPLRFDVYLADLCLRRAVERNVTIIGEAMNRILKNDPEINITAARKIVDTRNYVIHGYDSGTPDVASHVGLNPRLPPPPPPLNSVDLKNRGANAVTERTAPRLNKSICCG